MSSHPLLALQDQAGAQSDAKVRYMPYRTNRELPPPIRAHLPDHGQDIYREAFNSAYGAHAGEADRERSAHMIAWAAVKRRYVKDGETWVPRQRLDS